MTSTQKIQALLAAANGRRRERVIEWDRCASAIRAAAKYGPQWLTGGYAGHRSRAQTTVVGIIADADRVAVCIRRVPAAWPRYIRWEPPHRAAEGAAREALEEDYIRKDVVVLPREVALAF